MKYNRYSLEDFLDDKDFINWVTNPTDEFNEHWNAVIQKCPEKKTTIEEAVKLLELIHFRKLTISDRQRANILKNTISHRYSKRSKIVKKSVEKDRNNKYTHIAATILIIISLGVFLTFQSWSWFDISASSATEEVKMITKQNPAGRKSRFYLPDGSYVTLNADSQIDYYNNFKEKREVWLVGEASFEVKENLGNNFLVHTRNLTINVKGTTFNVSAFNSDLYESISLLSGKVTVSCINNHINEAYELIPGEKLSVDLESNLLTVSDLIMDDVIWSSGILVFKNDDIKSFTDKIQRWYGVLVEVSGTPKEKIDINGKFDNENLKNVLESLKFSTDIKYQLTDNRVQIQF